MGSESESSMDGPSNGRPDFSVEYTLRRTKCRYEKCPCEGTILKGQPRLVFTWWQMFRVDCNGRLRRNFPPLEIKEYRHLKCHALHFKSDPWQKECPESFRQVKGVNKLKPEDKVALKEAVAEMMGDPVHLKTVASACSMKRPASASKVHEGGTHNQVGRQGASLGRKSDKRKEEDRPEEASLPAAKRTKAKR